MVSPTLTVMGLLLSKGSYWNLLNYNDYQRAGERQKALDFIILHDICRFCKIAARQTGQADTLVKV